MQTAEDLTKQVKDPAASIEAFIEALPVPGAMIDDGLNLIMANQRLLGLIGYSIEEIRAKRLSALCSCSDFDLSRLTEAGRHSTGVNAGLITKKGALVPVTIFLAPIGGSPVMTALFSPVASGNGSLSELNALNKKLSDRVARLENFREGVLQILQELDAQEAELDSAYARLGIAQAHLIQSSKLGTLGELAAGLAHELNQPVTIIKGLAQSLLRGMRSCSEDIEKVRLIEDASSRMELIIRHMNIFARSEEQEDATCDLNSIIKYAFRLSAETLRQRAIKAVLDLSDLPRVKGSPVRLEQVIMNLITNARDAMPDGGTLGVKTSAITDEKGHEFALVSVSDTGVGITEEEIKLIFEPFFTTKEPGKGTGLGLSISRGIIRDHRGEISAESVPGMGTTFHITIPAINRDKQ